MNRVTAVRLLAVAAWTAAPAAFAQTTEGSDEVRAVVAEMLADAQNRSSLLAGGTGGHDGAFYLASDDGAFRLNVGGAIQFRYAMGFRDESDSDDFTTGFQMARTQVNFAGTVHKDWGYFVEGEFQRDGGSFNMNDAIISYKLNPSWTLLMGQMKAHVLREENINEKFQLTVDRSITNSVFTQGRSQAVAAVYQSDSFQFIPVFSDGAATEDTDYGTTAPLQSDYAFSGRVNWKFAGDWGAFSDFTSKRGSAFAGMIGAGAHYQESANTGNPADTDVGVLLYAIDAQLEGDGWNFFATFIGRQVQLDTLGGDSDFNDFGVVVQGGFMVSDHDELFARYDVVIPDSDRANGAGTGEADPFNTITAGWNHYLAGHAAKFTADVQYALDRLADTALVAPNSQLDYLGSTEDGEVAIRLQMQLMF
jgi:hypothetical protein